MRAGQWDTANQRVVVNDVPVPEPGPGQVLLKVTAASLCHSDLMQNMRPPNTVTTMGHEGVGVVSRVHPSVESEGFKPGDRVGALYFNGCCYSCDGCKHHQTHCEKGQWKLMGYTQDGFFAEYAVVDWQNLVHLPDTLDITRFSPVFCAGITAFHSVKSCDISPGDWFAVIGCGGLGQFAGRYARAMGANVIGIDINDDTLSIFSRLTGGATTFNSRSNPNYVADIRELTGGKGVHAVAVYSAASIAYTHAPKLLRINGVLMCVGIPADPISVSVDDLVRQTYRIKGESTSIPERMMNAVDFTIQHDIVPEVEFRRLDELQTMVEEMNAGNSERRKVVVFE